jgi:transcriptional regulator NrdR family protein
MIIDSEKLETNQYGAYVYSFRWRCPKCGSWDISQFLFHKDVLENQKQLRLHIGCSVCKRFFSTYERENPVWKGYPDCKNILKFIERLNGGVV